MDRKKLIIFFSVIILSLIAIVTAIVYPRIKRGEKIVGKENYGEIKIVEDEEEGRLEEFDRKIEAKDDIDLLSVFEPINTEDQSFKANVVMYDSNKDKVVFRGKMTSYDGIKEKNIYLDCIGKEGDLVAQGVVRTNALAKEEFTFDMEASFLKHFSGLDVGKVEIWAEPNIASER